MGDQEGTSFPATITAGHHDAPSQVSDDDLAVADDVAAAIIRLNRMHACMAAQLGKAGMDKTSFVLLFTLASAGPLRSSALAEAVFVDPSTISRQVAQLVKDGLVERRADPEDGRASVLAASEKGRALLAHHRERRNRSIAQMMTDWPAEDRALFAGLFQRFARDYERVLPIMIDEYAKGTYS
jgi:DNA-binding MarR family transcriptional regulator